MLAHVPQTLSWGHGAYAVPEGGILLQLTRQAKEHEALLLPDKAAAPLSDAFVPPPGGSVALPTTTVTTTGAMALNGLQPRTLLPAAVGLSGNACLEGLAAGSGGGGGGTTGPSLARVSVSSHLSYPSQLPAPGDDVDVFITCTEHELEAMRQQVC